MSISYGSILGLLIVCDAGILRRQSDRTFHQIIFSHPWVVLGVFMLMFALSWAAQEWSVFLSALFLIYLIRRRRFQKVLSTSISDNDQHLELRLATKAFDVVFFGILGSIALAVGVRGVAAAFPQIQSELGEMVMVAIFSSALILILIYRASSAYPDQNLKSILGLGQNFSKKFFLISISAGVIFAYLSAAIIFYRRVQPPTPLTQIMEATTSPTAMIIFFAVAVLLAPLFEELIFRGFFYNAIRRFKGKKTAVVIIALIFAMLHYEQYWGDWMAIAMITILGFALTGLRVWMGTTWASIIMHYTYNVGVTIIPIVMLMTTNPSFFEYQFKNQQLTPQTQETLLRKSIHDQPDFADAYNELAWLYVNQHRHLKEALRLIDQGLELSPENYAFLDTKAEVLYQLGRKKAAMEIVEKLRQKYPYLKETREQPQRFKRQDSEESRGELSPKRQPAVPN